MKCDTDNCSQVATHFINAQLIPLCQCCMLESLCSVATPVISIEAYEEKQRQFKVLNDWHIAS